MKGCEIEERARLAAIVDFFLFRPRQKTSPLFPLPSLPPRPSKQKPETENAGAHHHVVLHYRRHRPRDPARGAPAAGRGDTRLEEAAPVGRAAAREGRGRGGGSGGGGGGSNAEIDLFSVSFRALPTLLIRIMEKKAFEMHIVEREEGAAWGYLSAVVFVSLARSSTKLYDSLT
jgi:hypothetical protein